MVLWKTECFWAILDPNRLWKPLLVFTDRQTFLHVDCGNIFNSLQLCTNDLDSTPFEKRNSLTKLLLECCMPHLRKSIHIYPSQSPRSRFFSFLEKLSSNLSFGDRKRFPPPPRMNSQNVCCFFCSSNCRWLRVGVDALLDSVIPLKKEPGLTWPVFLIYY